MIISISDIARWRSFPIRRDLGLEKYIWVSFTHRWMKQWEQNHMGDRRWVRTRLAAAAAAKLLQLCPTLCDPIDGSPPGSPVPGILQARTLEWVAISFSSAWKWKVKVKLLSRVRLLETPWTAAHRAPLSMVFSRQEYWSGLPLPSPEDQAWVRSYSGDKKVETSWCRGHKKCS